MKATRAWIGAALMTGALFSLPLPPAGAVIGGRAAATTAPSVTGGKSAATIKVPVTPGQHIVSLQVPAAPGNQAAPARHHPRWPQGRSRAPPFRIPSR